jgi:hypothetical protein
LGRKELNPFIPISLRIGKRKKAFYFGKMSLKLLRDVTRAHTVNPSGLDGFIYQPAFPKILKVKGMEGKLTVVGRHFVAPSSVFDDKPLRSRKSSRARRARASRPGSQPFKK